MRPGTGHLIMVRFVIMDLRTHVFPVYTKAADSQQLPRDWMDLDVTYILTNRRLD